MLIGVVTILLLLGPESAAKPTVIVVVGAPGADEYAPQFRDWSERWRAAAENGGAEFKLIGYAKDANGTDRGRLQKTLADAAADGEPHAAAPTTDSS